MLSDVLKEFDKTFYEGDRNSIYCKKHNVYATPHEIKQFITEQISKAIDEEKKKWIDYMRNGRICTSCGKPMEEGMSQWCQDCLENN